MCREYLVILGEFDRGVDEHGIPFAHLTKMYDKMMLPEALVQIIPMRLIEQKLTQATDYIVPELFNGEVKF